MNNKERAAHWQRNIDQWQESGLSGAQFCKHHELDLGRLQNNFHQLRSHLSVVIDLGNTQILRK